MGNDTGILVQGIGRPILGGSMASANRIHDNGDVNIRNGTRNAVPARFNYWGEPTCDFVQRFLGHVDYLPFMNQALDDSSSACP